MIHAVTLFGDQKKQDLLELECIRANIRFVRKDFNSAEELLQEFETIDTTVDAAVISELQMDQTDKAEVIENLRTAEPNIRIIILFPGYRNQYIEDQIREYKEKFGITDILYEGNGIEAVYLAEAIRKDFLYGSEVNAYDEPREIAKQPEQKSCIQIGILGLTHGCGVTNMAVAVSSYIALSRNIPVKAIDYSGTGDLRFAKSKKVTYLVHSGIDIERILRTSSAAVFDFGAPFTISSKGKLLLTDSEFTQKQAELFQNCDLKICMCFADPWHIGKLKYFLYDKQWKKAMDDSWLFLADSIPEKQKVRGICLYTRNDEVVEEKISRLFSESKKRS